MAASTVQLAGELRTIVTHLAGTIGERNTSRRPARLDAAADWLTNELKATDVQTYEADGHPCRNLGLEIRGTSKPDEIVVIGGHYDSVVGSPGANDNGSGAAATLALARRFAGTAPARTLRFVEFTNEEPPHFMTPLMGSHVYARRCATRKEKIVAMLSLETMGYFSDEKGSQNYPLGLGWIYPSRGNFIAFVANWTSRRLMKRVVKTFRANSAIPAETGALPAGIPGVAWSDQWSFWEHGYPGIMVTDTAPFRYPHYHEPTDTPDKVDYEKLAGVVEGLVPVIEDLTR